MDSDFIKTKVEPIMRDLLAAALHVPTLRERIMPLRWNGEGQGKFAFDAVSEDGTVVACLSTARNLKAGQRHKLMRDATFMWLVPGATERVLAVVEPGVAQSLQSELERGLIPPGTKIAIVTLPAEVREALETFRLSAANEVGGVKKREGLTP
jgi:hypothetical protein